MYNSEAVGALLVIYSKIQWFKTFVIDLFRVCFSVIVHYVVFRRERAACLSHHPEKYAAGPATTCSFKNVRFAGVTGISSSTTSTKTVPLMSGAKLPFVYSECW